MFDEGEGEGGFVVLRSFALSCRGSKLELESKLIYSSHNLSLDTLSEEKREDRAVHAPIFCGGGWWLSIEMIWYIVSINLQPTYFLLHCCRVESGGDKDKRQQHYSLVYH